MSVWRKACWDSLLEQQTTSLCRQAKTYHCYKYPSEYLGLEHVRTLLDIKTRRVSGADTTPRHFRVRTHRSLENCLRRVYVMASRRPHTGPRSGASAARFVQAFDNVRNSSNFSAASSSSSSSSSGGGGGGGGAAAAVAPVVAVPPAAADSANTGAEQGSDGGLTTDERRREVLGHGVSSNKDYQGYLHRFCVDLRARGKLAPEMITDGVTTFHDPPCPRLEDLRMACPPGRRLQPRMSAVSTRLFVDFLVDLKVEHRFSGPNKGSMVVPGKGTHNWFRNAMVHAFKISGQDKPLRWDAEVGEFIKALQKKQAAQKKAGTYQARYTGGRDKMDFNVYRRSMFDFITGAMSSNNPKNNEVGARMS